MRQHDLRLEKHWVTEDGYFRIATTFFGITVTDAWRTYRHHMRSSHRHYKMEMNRFVSLLAKDLLCNSLPTTAETPNVFCIISPPNEVTVLDQRNAEISTITDNEDMIHRGLFRVNYSKKHYLVKSSDMTAYANREESGTVREGQRSKRKRCQICTGKTPYFCAGCTMPWNTFYVCAPSRQKNCLARHLDDVCAHEKQMLVSQGGEQSVRADTN